MLYKSDFEKQVWIHLYVICFNHSDFTKNTSTYAEQIFHYFNGDFNGDFNGQYRLTIKNMKESINENTLYATKS